MKFIKLLNNKKKVFETNFAVFSDFFALIFFQINIFLYI